MQVQSLGWEDRLEESMATWSSILVWEIPWTGKSGRLQSMGHKESDMTEQCTHTHTQTMLVNEQRLPLFVYVTSAASVIKPQSSGVANRDLMTCQT